MEQLGELPTSLNLMSLRKAPKVYPGAQLVFSSTSNNSIGKFCSQSNAPEMSRNMTVVAMLKELLQRENLVKAA
ncbi:hypothetical protein T265_02489 [Opisthorchis viverrini]|uniref:Uncharacterized protein n=1 Tax=Opisthorchis viverrini TaxID=6198 RepID=A0A074ZV11_OPIVI|nr:hypothetical protein T265_02489 [Opisthorchis viverrini]KER31308.1 hypothetical protein T265_02489 [Opisthorchis viverrini]